MDTKIIDVFVQDNVVDDNIKKFFEVFTFPKVTSCPNYNIHHFYFCLDDTCTYCTGFICTEESRCKYQNCVDCKVKNLYKSWFVYIYRYIFTYIILIDTF